MDELCERMTKRDALIHRRFVACQRMRPHSARDAIHAGRKSEAPLSFRQEQLRGDRQQWQRRELRIQSIEDASVTRQQLAAVFHACLAF